MFRPRWGGHAYVSSLVSTPTTFPRLPEHIETKERAFLCHLFVRRGGSSVSGNPTDTWGVVPLSAGDKMPTSDSEDETLAAEPVHKAPAPQAIRKTPERKPGDQAPAARINDRACLRALYKKCGGRLWIQRQWWMTNVPLGQWRGVTDRDGRVVRLRLRGTKLQGEAATGLGTTEDDDTTQSIG